MRVLRFKEEFDEYPSQQDIYNRQEDLGYSPLGYDGPWNISVITNEPSEQKIKYIATWECSASCD